MEGDSSENVKPFKEARQGVQQRVRDAPKKRWERGTTNV